MNSYKMTGLGMMALCAGVAGFGATPVKAGAITGVTGGFQDYTTSNGKINELMGKINVQQNAVTGDVTITFLQGVNDNVYGTSATTDPMWGSHGHTFSDLLGSDKAEFIIYGGSTALLDVTIDYVASVTGTLSWSTVDGTMTKSYASGYGTAGFFVNTSKGGTIANSDGSITNSANSKYVLNFDTTLTDNLNQSPAYYGDTTNSPVGDPNWNNVNGYTLTIAGQLFTDNSKSFGGVNLALVHDSPEGNYETPTITTVPLPSAAWGGMGLIGLLAGTKLSRRLRRSRAELA